MKRNFSKQIAVNLILVIFFAFINPSSLFAASTENLVSQIKTQGLGETGEIRSIKDFPDSHNSVVVIGEFHIGQSQTDEIKLIEHLIKNNNVSVIYTEGIDSGKTIDTEKYKNIFKTDKTKSILKQVVLDMVNDNEISALDYSKYSDNRRYR